MMAFDIVLQIVMLGLAGAAGYGIRALHKPFGGSVKRGKNGRFTKK
jgi:hypothetical protein